MAAYPKTESTRIIPPYVPESTDSGTDHTVLSNLSWTSSGHSGLTSSLAGFNALGAATYYSLSLFTPPDPSDANPSALGAVSAGVSADYSRADHVHSMPSASDVGADPAGTASTAITTHETTYDHSLLSSLSPVATSGSYADLTGTPIVGTDIQAWDVDLDALTAVASTGFISRTGSGTFVTRTLQAGTEILVSNGDGISGDPTISVGSNVFFADGTRPVTGTIDFNDNNFTNANSGDIHGLTVDYKINLNFVIPPLVKMTATLAGVGPGNVDPGIHYYIYTFYTAEGETSAYQLGSSGTNVTTTLADGQVDLTVPTSSDPRVIGRRIYRTTAGSAYFAGSFLLVDIADNITTSYRDNIADASLTGTSQYLRENTTNVFIEVNNQPVMWASSNNTTFGYQALKNLWAGLLTGGEHVVMGYQAGRSITSATKNVLIGFNAGNNTTGSGSNVAIGHGALFRQNNGSSNIAIGRNAMLFTSSGTGNVYIGYASGFGTTSGTTTNYNVGIGHSSLFSIDGGLSNTALGRYAGYNLTSGNYNIALGAYVDVPSATGVAQLNIGNLIYGVDLYSTPIASSTPVAGKVGVGKVPTTYMLEVADDTSVEGQLYSNSLQIHEQASAPAVAAGDGAVWVQNTTPSSLWFTDDTGASYNLLSSSGGSSNTYSPYKPPISSFANDDEFQDSSLSASWSIWDPVSLGPTVIEDSNGLKIMGVDDPSRVDSWQGVYKSIPADDEFEIIAHIGTILSPSVTLGSLFISGLALFEDVASSPTAADFIAAAIRFQLSWKIHATRWASFDSLTADSTIYEWGGNSAFTCIQHKQSTGETSFYMSKDGISWFRIWNIILTPGSISYMGYAVLPRNIVCGVRSRFFRVTKTGVSGIINTEPGPLGGLI